MDSNLFIRTLYEKNLSTWFILPLLGMNINDFMAGNVLNTYLTRDLKYLTVTIKLPSVCFLGGKPAGHLKYFVKSAMINGVLHMVYRIPEEINEDVYKFTRGEYSKLSSASKAIIKNNSTLPYKLVNTKGVEVTDAVLMALDRLGTLQRTWMELLGVHKENLPQELLDIPGDKCYIELEIKNP